MVKYYYDLFNKKELKETSKEFAEKAKKILRFFVVGLLTGTIALLILLFVVFMRRYY